MMVRRGIAKTALAQIPLLQEVAAYSQAFHSSAKARLDLAKPGTLRLVPEGELVRRLADDYRAMAIMIFGDPPLFGDIMADLKDLEDRINEVSRA
jgi:hypothetical protein